jgi:hypothetical protein
VEDAPGDLVVKQRGADAQTAPFRMGRVLLADVSEGAYRLALAGSRGESRTSCWVKVPVCGSYQRAPKRTSPLVTSLMQANSADYAVGRDRRASSQAMMPQTTRTPAAIRKGR